MDAQGSRGTVKITLTLVNRTDVPRITEFLHGNFPDAFFSIGDVRYASEGVFRPKNTHSVSGILGSPNPWKKK